MQGTALLRISFALPSPVWPWLLEDRGIPENIDRLFTGKVFGWLIVQLKNLIAGEKLAMSGAACGRENR